MATSDSIEKETTFAPGPWSVGEPHPQNACAYVLGADGDEVATLYGGDQAKKDDDGIWGSQPIRDATANLIAAAPELYEALSRALAGWGLEKSEPGLNLMEIEKQMKTALARARGEDRSHEGK
mgnify:FL=1